MPQTRLVASHRTVSTAFPQCGEAYGVTNDVLDRSLTPCSLLQMPKETTKTTRVSVCASNRALSRPACP